jgi:2,4'-dihydroxyacetophenone dioxygenase
MSSATSVKQSSGTQVTTANQGNELTTIQIPPAFAVASDDLPFVDDWLGIKGVRLKLLMADIEGGRFTVQIRFAPGLQMPPHKHTGEVHAYTLEGEWYYLEYDGQARSKAGSYLYEPPGSTHTLKIADHNAGETDVVFVVYGALLHLDETGAVAAIGDAESHLRDYAQAVRALGGGAKVGAIPIGGSMTMQWM